MKNSLLLAAILIAGSAQAQWKKISFRVSGNVPVIKSTIDHSLLAALPVATESGFTIVSVNVDTRQSYSGKVGFDLGSRCEYGLTKRFFLSGGVSVTYLRFGRSTEMINPSGVSFPSSSLTDVPGLGNTTIWNLQVPVLGGFSFLGDKVKVKAGPTFACLLQATEVKQQYNLASASYSEYKDHSKESFNKFQAAGTVEVTFQMTKRIGVDANAQYFVTSMYGNGNSPYTPYTTLGLGISCSL